MDVSDYDVEELNWKVCENIIFVYDFDFLVFIFF